MSATCIACAEGEWKVTTLSTATVNKYQKYLTDVWAKASSYTWGKTTTTTLSFSAGLSSDLTSKIKSTYSLTASVSKSYSVSITVPADSSRYSKLGLYGDFHRRYIKGEYVKFGKVQETKYGYSYEPTKDQYLKVVYQ